MANSSETVTKNKGGNPNWTKGTSGNPSGRPPNHFGKYLRQHPNVPLVIEKIMDSALNDDDPRQKDAWKIIANKVAPDLRAQEIKAEVDTHVGVIRLPSKKPIQIEAESTPLLPNKIDGGLETGKQFTEPPGIAQEKDPPTTPLPE